MVLPASGSISMSSIRSEFGLSGQVSLSDLRNKGVLSKTPSSGPISLSDFHSKRKSELLVDLRAAPYDESAMLWYWTDQSTYGHEFIQPNYSYGPTYNLVGSTLKYFTFDGTNDYFRCDGISQFQSGGVTIEAWYKPNNFKGTDGDTSQFIVNIGSTALIADLRLQSMNSPGTTGRVTMRVGGNGGATPGQFLYAGQWYHIVGTYEVASSTSRPTKLYLNGQVRGSSDYGSSAKSIESSTQNYSVSIGNYESASSNHLNSFQLRGDLGEVRIYDGCLNSGQVNINYMRTRSKYMSNGVSSDSGQVYGY